MKIMKNVWLWYSSLSEKVFLWKNKKVNDRVRQFTWDKKDVTNEFLHIVDQYFEKWTSRIVTKWEEESLFIHIKNTKESKEKLIKSLQKELWEHTQ